MAATAQDPSAPLRGPEKKDEDRDEDSECTSITKVLAFAHYATYVSPAYPIYAFSQYYLMVLH